MTALSLAFRTSVRYKARTLLAIAGIATIGALNFDMLLLSRGLLVSFADMINSVGFDVRVVGSAGLPVLRSPMSGARTLSEEIRRLPEVEEVALVRMTPASVLEPKRPSVRVVLVGTTESSARGGWRLIRGENLGSHDPSRLTAPTGPSGLSGPTGLGPQNPPLIVARRLASLLDLQPGSPLRFRVSLQGAASALPAVTGRVVGIADFSFESADEYSMATTMDGFDLARGGKSDDADLILVASSLSAGPDAAVRAIARLHPDLHVYSNDQVIAQFNRNGFAYFRQISAVLSTTTVVFTVLLVAVLLTVSVNQRLGEVAALRALGISRRRIASMLLGESALLVSGGGTLALPLGAALAVALDRILRRMPGLPERLHFFVFEPRALVAHALLLTVTAVAAALYPMWLAVKLPIAETLRRETVS